MLKVKTTICGCDQDIPSSCMNNETAIQQTILNRLTRSIESPITALWEKLKVLSTQPQIPPQHRQPDQDQVIKTACQSATLIQCIDSTHRIRIVKADLSNTNSNTCQTQQTSNVSGTVQNNTCSSNRVQSTELAQKKYHIIISFI